MRVLKRSVPSLTGFPNSIQLRGMYTDFGKSWSFFKLRFRFHKSLEPNKKVRNVKKWPNLYSVKLRDGLKSSDRFQTNFKLRR